MVNPKFWLASRTILCNLLGAVALPWVGVATGTVSQETATTATVIAAGNLILRAVTKQPLSLSVGPKG